MTLLPAAWLGLTTRAADPTYDLARAREVVAVLALFAGWLELRGRRRAALAAALAAVVVATGFWSLALRRPYGLLVDPRLTAWAADTMVSARAGGTDRLLAGEPGTETAGRVLAQRLPPDLVLSIPALLPPAILAVSALAIASLWPARAAALAAILWAAASTGGLDSLRGVGLVDLVWPHPGRAMLWLSGTLVVLVLSRALRRHPRAVAVATAVVTVVVCARDPVVRLSPLDGLMLLVFDQHLWLAAGALGIAAARDPLATTLVGVGAALVLVSTVTAAVDTWTAAALYRLGLILASSQGVEEVARRLAASGALDGLKRWTASPERAVTAVVVTLTLAGGYVAWWDPRTDPVAKESLAPVPEALVQATDWIRDHTDPGAAVLAHEDYAPAVAALAGRRVLRAPGLVVASDDERRRRLEQAVLEGRPAEALRRRYDLRYVFLAPGQFAEYGLAAPEQLESRGPFRLLYGNDKGMRVYEISEGPR